MLVGFPVIQSKWNRPLVPCSPYLHEYTSLLITCTSWLLRHIARYSEERKTALSSRKGGDDEKTVMCARCQDKDGRVQQGELPRTITTIIYEKS